MAGDDLVEEGELDGAVVGREGEEVGLRHDHLRPPDDPHRHHREPDALENGFICSWIQWKPVIKSPVNRLQSLQLTG